MAKFHGTLYGSSTRSISRTGSLASGIQAVLEGSSGTIFVNIYHDEHENGERVSISRESLAPEAEARDYIYQGPLSLKDSDETYLLLSLARKSTDHAVQQALDHLLMVTKLAHGEEIVG